MLALEREQDEREGAVPARAASPAMGKNDFLSPKAIGNRIKARRQQQASSQPSCSQWLGTRVCPPARCSAACLAHTHIPLCSLLERSPCICRCVTAGKGPSEASMVLRGAQKHRCTLPFICICKHTSASAHPPDVLSPLAGISTLLQGVCVSSRVRKKPSCLLRPSSVCAYFLLLRLAVPVL